MFPPVLRIFIASNFIPLVTHFEILLEYRTTDSYSRPSPTTFKHDDICVRRLGFGTVQSWTPWQRSGPYPYRGPCSTVVIAWSWFYFLPGRLVPGADSFVRRHETSAGGLIQTLIPGSAKLRNNERH